MEKIYPPGYLPLPETTLSAVTIPEQPPEFSDAEIEASMPRPVGHKLLLAMPSVDEKHDGSVLVKARTTIHAEEMTSVVALVVDMGPDAYQDKTRFPTGAWCKVGDYILIGPYKGQRFSVCGKEYRIINDDVVEGIASDPRGYRRI